MAGILDLLNSDLGKTLINGVSSSSGQNQNKTGALLAMALPVLMEAMKKNTATKEGKEGLFGAINEKHNGGILDNLGDLFKGGVNKEVEDDGNKILDHILGKDKSQVQQTLSEKSGIGISEVGGILAVAAPILMGILGKNKREQNIQNSDGLGGLLDGLLSGTPEKDKNVKGGLLDAILDSNNDGSILDDVAGMVLGGNSKSKSGLGGLLGGLFGKR